MFVRLVNYGFKTTGSHIPVLDSCPITVSIWVWVEDGICFESDGAQPEGSGSFCEKDSLFWSEGTRLDFTIRNFSNGNAYYIVGKRKSDVISRRFIKNKNRKLVTKT